MRVDTAIDIAEVYHVYGERTALNGVSLQVKTGEMFGLLGPNGGGKTTLFQMLSTTLVPQKGTVRILGYDAVRESARVRAHIGVVFQHPSLDPKLTVLENLRHQGHLYGLWGQALSLRIDEALGLVRLTDRAGDRADTLSGGLQRRVELAKGILHQPSVLVFDEPCSGLDPGARRAFWDDLDVLRKARALTLILTTHFMEEAERCDRIGILDEGRLIALGAPEALKREVGQDVIVLRTPDPDGLGARLRDAQGLDVQVVGGAVRIACAEGQRLLSELYPLLREEVEAMTLSRPSLEDVFIQRTGHRFDAEGA